MSGVKVCNKCSVELVVGENWAPGNAKCSNYRCKKCHYLLARKWVKNNPERFKDYHTKWNKDNIEKIRVAIRKWNDANPEKNKGYKLKHKEKEGSGVYLIKYRWINFYVGEGWFVYRKDKHLKYKFSKNNNSDVAEICDERNLNRKYLSFHILEYLDDKDTMLEREKHYRRTLKPYLNPLK